MEKPLRINRVSVTHGVLVAFAIALVVQAARVQIFQGKEWAERARRQQFVTGNSHGSRGNVFDASGNVLVDSRELYRLAVAPPELKDTAELVAAMEASGFPRDWIKLASDKRLKWVQLPGLHAASEVASLTGLRGVHAQ